MSARRLLLIHYDDQQLTACASVLRQGGYRVEGAKNLVGALRWLSYDAFDLIVIGESVLKSQLPLVLERIRETTRSPVILVRRGEPLAGLAVDGVVKAEEGETALLAAVDALLLNSPGATGRRPDPTGTVLR